MIINERQLKKIVYLLEAEEEFNEALGVPNNIYETAKNIVDKIEEFFATIDTNKLNNTLRNIHSAKLNHDINDKFTISDYIFTKIKFDVSIFETLPNANIKLPMIYSASILQDHGPYIENNIRSIKYYENRSTGTINLSMEIAVAKNYDTSNLSEFIKNNNDKIVPMFTHELMHAYDHYKTPLSNIKQLSLYETPMSIAIGVPEIDKFLYFMYYTENAENIVRPSEIFAYMKMNKTNEDDFKTFIEENNVFKKLKEIMNYSYSELLNNLKNDIKKIDAYVKNNTTSFAYQKFFQNIPKDEKIKFIMTRVFENYKTKSEEFYSGSLGVSNLPYSKKTPEQEKAINKMKDEFKKYKNANSFFTNYMKIMKYKAFNVYKKLLKLYSLAEPSQKPKEKPNKIFK